MIETQNDGFLQTKGITVSRRIQKSNKGNRATDDATSERCPLDSLKRLHKLLSLSRFIDRCTLLPWPIRFTWDFNDVSLSLSLPRRPCILSSPCLPSFPSRVPVSLTSRGYFDWGQTLGFHTIYNAALSNGIEYERGWNEHMLEKWRVRCAREEPKRLTQRSGKSKRKISKIDFIYTNLCVYIYIIKASRIRSILIWKINRSYSMNNSFLPLPLEPTIVFCTIHGISLKNSYRADRGKKWPVVCLTVRIYRSRKVTEVHTEPRFRPKLNCSRL